LQEITNAAERLCVNVKQSGQESSAKLSGDVKAELSGLAKRLADAGVSGAGQIQSKEYEGVVQGQLADTLKDM